MDLDYKDLTKLSYYRGRVALYAILRGLGIGKGDEVAIQAFTCLAVPEAVFATGAKPRYIDIEAEGFNMSPDDLEAKLTPQTRAVVVQHTFGIPAQLDRLMAIAQRAGIPVIEDCCHTFKSTFAGQLLGTFGIASFYSFESGKPVVVGLGGSALVHDAELRRRVEEAYAEYRQPSLMRQARLDAQYWAFMMLYRPRLFWPVRTAFHSLSRVGAVEGNFHVTQDNGQPDEDFSLRMSSHLRRRLARRLRSIDAHALHSRRLVDQYREGIVSPAVKHPAPPSQSETVYARYPLRVADKAAMLERAQRDNVELADWYSTPIHPVPVAQGPEVGYDPGSCPQAEIRSGEIVTLPTHRRTGKWYINKVVQFFSEMK